MDNEKIKELAEQYADKECAMSKHKGKRLRQLHEDKIIEFYDVLGFLSETHCIVEKEKIKALYSKMELDGNHVDSDNDWAVYEAMDELEKIFGKELFYGTEK